MSEFPNSAHQVIEQADPTDPHPEATLCPRSTTVATPPIHIAEHFTTLENVRNGLEIGKRCGRTPYSPPPTQPCSTSRRDRTTSRRELTGSGPPRSPRGPRWYRWESQDSTYFKEVWEIAGSSPPSPRSPPTLPLRQSYWRDPEF